MAASGHCRHRYADRYDERAGLLRGLKLPTMAATFREVAVKAAKAGLTHATFLYELARRRANIAPSARRRAASSFAPIPLPIHPAYIFDSNCNQESCNEHQHVAAFDCTKSKHQCGGCRQHTYDEENNIGDAEPHAHTIAYASTTGMGWFVVFCSSGCDYAANRMLY
jgi:hypothetical protein